MKPTSPCPSFEMLCSWVAGKLDDTASEEVGLHLEFCTACESMVTRIERERPDTIAQQMKGLGTLSRSLKVPDLQIENEVDNPADEIDLPDSIDSYKIVRILGHGGMGVVYEVEHPLLKRHDAIKLVKPKHRLRPEMQERLRREMEAVSRLEHTNIVRAYSAGIFEGQPYLVMELLAGTDLAAFVSKRPPISFEMFVKVGRQIVSGLRFAHEAGVIHRDVKPSNIFLTKSGIVKILDFGLAKPFESETQADATGRTKSGVVLGTCDYIAPEQIEGASTVDHRADIYSLGCTFFFLLTGKAPYTGSQANVLASHLRDPFPSLHDLRPDLPEAIDQLLQEMTAKKPGKRIQTMEEVEEALQLFSLPVTESDAKNGKPLWVVVALLALFIMVAGTIFISGHWNIGPSDAKETGTTRTVGQTSNALDVPRSRIFWDTEMSGRVRFDYEKNEGRYAIGEGEHLFETRWGYVDRSHMDIHADTTSVRGVALAGVPLARQVDRARDLDYSEPVRRARINDIVILKNRHDKYAVVKIIRIVNKAETPSAEKSLVDFVYSILPEGDNFKDAE